ncbi:hypothetical protein BC826DRAFT_1038461 [Russula brevipes]|nr:hypothetical protein BC826DRAFT_1038461 [Russula brevipes]
MGRDSDWRTQITAFQEFKGEGCSLGFLDGPTTPTSPRRFRKTPINILGAERHQRSTGQPVKSHRCRLVHGWVRLKLSATSRLCDHAAVVWGILAALSRNPYCRSVTLAHYSLDTGFVDQTVVRTSRPATTPSTFDASSLAALIRETSLRCVSGLKVFLEGRGAATRMAGCNCSTASHFHIDLQPPQSPTPSFRSPLRSSIAKS